MKRKKILFSLWGLWFCLLIAMVFCVNFYIDKKRIKLRSELIENIESLFDGQSSGSVFVTNDDGFFDEAFSGFPVRHYKKIAIPSRPSKEVFKGIDSKMGKELAKYDEKIDDDWKQSYGDLASLYELNWGDEYPNENDEGWNIIRIHYGGADDDIIQTNVIFPYKVGLKKTEWGNYYTVEQAVNEAFEFYTTDAKSGFSNRYQKGSNSRIWSKIYDCNNEYFSIVKNEKYGGWTAGIPIYRPKNMSYEKAQRLYPYENGWMHNGFYRVFIAATQTTHYMIEENEIAVTADRKKLLIGWGISITILFMLLIIPLTIKERKANKIKAETLYQRLLRLCNPKNFIKEYDKDKIDKANKLYQPLLNMNSDDKDALMQMQSMAVSELGISLIDKEELDELKQKVNPQNFMQPYDAEKVSLANELYSILSDENIDYVKMMEVKEKLKTL